MTQIEQAIEALASISLSSQNSSCTKEDCGRIARKALAALRPAPAAPAAPQADPRPRVGAIEALTAENEVLRAERDALRKEVEALKAMLMSAAEHAEWSDKIINPCHGEPFQCWRFVLYANVPVDSPMTAREAMACKIDAARGEQA